MIRIVPRRSVELRCALCHDVAAGARPCAACGTLTHADCRADAGACPTLGCSRRVRVVLDVGGEREATWRFVLREVGQWLREDVWVQGAVALAVALLLVIAVQKCAPPSPVERYVPYVPGHEITSRIPGG